MPIGNKRSVKLLKYVPSSLLNDCRILKVFTSQFWIYCRSQKTDVTGKVMKTDFICAIWCLQILKVGQNSKFWKSGSTVTITDQGIIYPLWHHILIHTTWLNYYTNAMVCSSFCMTSPKGLNLFSINNFENIVNTNQNI